MVVWLFICVPFRDEKNDKNEMKKGPFISRACNVKLLRMICVFGNGAVVGQWSGLRHELQCFKRGQRDRDREGSTKGGAL